MVLKLLVTMEVAIYYGN